MGIVKYPCRLGNQWILYVPQTMSPINGTAWEDIVYKLTYMASCSDKISDGLLIHDNIT